MTAPHDRDESLARALTRALVRVGDASDACLDAETLAAWTDHGLDAEAAARAEAHVSSCARCQALVATMARTLPDDPLASPEGRSVWRWWFGPLVAAAAATTIWIVLPEPRQAPPAPESVVADAPFAARPAPLDAPATLDAPAAVAESAAVQEAPRETAAGETGAPKVTADLREPPSTPAPSAGAPAARDRASDAPAATAPGVASQERAAAAFAAPAQALRATPTFEVAAPDGLTRWRVVSGRIAERSTDDGRTWAPLPGALDGDARAGAAPSGDLCWLAGADGAVWLAVADGAFTRLTAPGIVDLVAVVAVDAREATVTAADGRRFRTRDGGTTWAEVRE